MRYIISPNCCSGIGETLRCFGAEDAPPPLVNTKLLRRPLTTSGICKWCIKAILEIVAIAKIPITYSSDAQMKLDSKAISHANLYGNKAVNIAAREQVLRTLTFSLKVNISETGIDLNLVILLALINLFSFKKTVRKPFFQSLLIDGIYFKTFYARSEKWHNFQLLHKML